MEWNFKELTNSDTKVDPSHLEFFRSRALHDSVNALVREDIQNRLDANKGNSEPLRVRYYLSAKDKALKVKQTAKWLNGLEPHLNAPKTLEELGVNQVFNLEQSMPYLLIEGFNTTGLKGDPLETKDPTEDANRNDFYWFIRNVGRNGKKAGDRGRWGLGKIVYPASSNIRSFFCYSVREGDFKQALIGRSVLAIHAINGPEYVSEGYFAEFKDENPEFAIPQENRGQIDQFVQDFKIMRTPDQPGVSLVIPFPEKSITYGSLVQSVIKSYFWEILRGTMEVEIAQGDQKTVISEHSINDVVMSWAGLEEKEREITQRRLEFCRKSDRMKLANAECYFELSAPKSYGNPRMQDLFKGGEEAYRSARDSYRAGEIVALELCVSFKEKKTGTKKEGSFLLYLQKDEELDQPDETFIRDGLTIINEGYIREAGVRALVLAEHEPLNEFLGDAENPAHTEWLSSTKHFHGKYFPGRVLLEYVQRSALRMANVLGKVENELLEDLLDDIFGIPTEHDSKALETSPTNKRGRKKQGIKKPKSRPRYLETHPLKNGFTVSKATNATGTPDRVVIQMAYEAEGVGNPFSPTHYHPSDFNLKDDKDELVVETDGCKILRLKPNLLELAIDKEEFSISIVGFDPKRDLRIDARPFVDKSSEEGEQ